MRVTLSRFITSAGLLAASTLAAPADDAYFAPPPAVTVQGQPAPETPVFHAADTGPTLYSIGQPTSQEQYLLELLNRARGNVTAEADRLAASTDANITGAMKYFGVSTSANITQMKDQFATLPSPLPPLAFNADLMETSYLHSVDMKNTGQQIHGNSANPPGNLTPDGDFASRLSDLNYPYSYAAENIFSNALDVDQIHASFEIDWGPASAGAVFGMQVPPGHRDNNHDLDDSVDPVAIRLYREIGIGVITGPGNGNIDTVAGPLVATYDMGFQTSDTPFITGVVYKDNDGNGFYTPGNINNPNDFGEGVGGVTVTVSNTTFYAVTSNSGGYTVPVPGDGTYTVTFSGGGLATNITTVTVSGGNNVEADYVIAASAPITITKAPASTTAIIGNPASFSVSATASNGGTLSYQWQFKNAALKGATKSSYAISKVAATNAGSYNVVIKNSKGGSLTSSSATLSTITKVAITTQPKTQTVKAGQSATFSVKASGNPSPSIFSWTFGSQPITVKNEPNVTGNGTATLKISNVAAANAGSYQVTVYNALNGVMSKATSGSAKLTVTVTKTKVK